MLNVERLHKLLLSRGVDFYTGVPDSLLKDFSSYLFDHIPGDRHIIAANEGSAIGIAAGHYLATGRIPLVYMQNSGLGNSVNPLLSLNDSAVYGLPALMMIGWRGEPGTKDEPQHKKQGEVTLDLLDAMRIPYIILEDSEEKAREQVNRLISSAEEKSSPHAIVVRKGTFEKYRLANKPANDYPLSREDALKIVVDSLSDRDIVVSTTGKLSRELFEYREFKNQGHERDFLTVGSMGHSSSIALGIALNKKKRQVVCLDGDGAFIMHMGAISNIGDLAPGNYKHILFNNGAHESVGGQPTLGFGLDIPAIAKAAGYRRVITASTPEEMQEGVRSIMSGQGPSLLELRINAASRDDLGRPTSTPQQNRSDFMQFVDNE